MKLILLCDDDEMIQDLFKEFIEDRPNYTIECYGNGLEFLKRAKTAKPDLAIIDKILPAMSGVEIIDKLWAQYNDVPVLMISGVHPITFKLDKPWRGPFIFIQKPFNKTHILGLIDSLLLD